MHAAPSRRALLGAALTAAVAAATLLALGTPRPAAAVLAAGDPATPDAVPGQIIVRYAPSTSPAGQDAIAERASARPVRELLLPRTELVKVPRGTSVEDAIEALEREPGVLSAEPNLRLQALAKPSDELFGQLWGLENVGQPVGGVAGAADADIDATEAWDMITGSRDVVVGVLDTGVDYDHADLAGQIATNPGESGDGKENDAIDNDGNGYVDDWRGWDFVDDDNDPFDLHNHGTHVAGTIGARGDNGSGIAGVNWNAAILPLRFLNEYGGGTMADLVDALVYIGRQRVPIVNGSFGGTYPSEAAEAAIAAATDTLFVFAAGNSGTNNDQYPMFPCSYELPNIVCVAATDQRDRRATFSNYGIRKVDLAAPGVGVLSTVSRTDDGVANGFDYYSGTSMAAPHVAGVAALARSFAPTLSTAELKAAVLAGAEPLASLRGLVGTGGRVNAERTLEAVYASAGTGVELRYDRASKRYLARIEVALDGDCPAPCSVGALELDGRERSGFRSLGRVDVDVRPGQRLVVDVPVTKRQLLRLAYARKGDALIAQTRARLIVQMQDRELDPVFTSRTRISARAIHRGAFPGLRPILPR